MELAAVSFKEACTYVEEHHRHHKKPQGWKFGVSLKEDGAIVGVAFVGRPVARKLNDGLTLEVTRLCTNGTKNACSMLYGACTRAAKALGYKRMITYTLPEEGGSSLRASGWTKTGQTPGKSWSVPSRQRDDKHPLGVKDRWEILFL